MVVACKYLTENIVFTENSLEHSLPLPSQHGCRHILWWPAAEW